jgi:hypothetical protein
VLHGYFPLYIVAFFFFSYYLAASATAFIGSANSGIAPNTSPYNADVLAGEKYIVSASMHIEAQKQGMN